MHIKSQINKTTIYFCSRCYGYLTMDVKFKNRKKDLGGVSKLKQQVQRYAFCLHSKWCSEVKGHTCTRLHQEVGRRRQWERLKQINLFIYTGSQHKESDSSYINNGEKRE